MVKSIKTEVEAKALLDSLFDAALMAALPSAVIEQHLPEAPTGRVIVLGAGKASAAMAQAVEKAWPKADLSGVVVTRYDHAVPTERVRILEAGHPNPDANGVAATEAIMAAARSAGPDDLVLCLISGGASALLTAPTEGVSFEEKQRLNAALLASGAPIDEMNTVRKRLSCVKGGRLADAIAPAACLTLLISDVPGDEPTVIGSGPTVPDPTPVDASLEILDRYNISVSDDIRAVMAANDGLKRLPENHRVSLIATPQMSLVAAAQAARAAGIKPIILGDAIEGEAREVSRVMAGIAKQVKRHGQPVEAPVVLLSGGETTVTVRGDGRGGRNSEFSLGLALALDGEPGIYSMACDTDGIDGIEDNAGAFVSPDTLARCVERGLDARDHLHNNDSYRIFDALDQLVVTGPTLTNVNDFRAILITGE